MKKFTLYSLFPDELTMVSKRILGFLVSFVQTEPMLKATYNVVLKGINEMKRTLSRDKKSQYTLKLLEKDVIRDDAFIRFRDFVKSFLKDPDPAIRDVAKRVTDIIRKHGYSLNRLPFIRQSIAMNLLIAELKETKNLQLVNLLGASSHLSTMEEASIDYENLRQEKVDEETQREYEKLYIVFRELSGDLKDLIKYVALANKGQYRPDELPNIISSIEKEVTDAMAAARNRQTRKEAKKSTAA